MKIYAIRLLVGNSEEPLPEGSYIDAVIKTNKEE